MFLYLKNKRSYTRIVTYLSYVVPTDVANKRRQDVTAQVCRGGPWECLYTDRCAPRDMVSEFFFLAEKAHSEA